MAAAAELVRAAIARIGGIVLFAASTQTTFGAAEPQGQVGQNLQRYGLGSPTAVIRMMVQQSNCFQIVERGVGRLDVVGAVGVEDQDLAVVDAGAEDDLAVDLDATDGVEVMVANPRAVRRFAQALMTRNKTDTAETAATRECPYCLSKIPIPATRCAGSRHWR